MMDKMYVIIRKDLSKSQQAVQGGHAVAQYLIKNKNCLWKNGTLIYLRAKDESKLLDWLNIFKNKNMNYEAFREPDIGNQVTAISTINKGDLFKWELLL